MENIDALSKDTIESNSDMKSITMMIVNKEKRYFDEKLRAKLVALSEADQYASLDNIMNFCSDYLDQRNVFLNHLDDYVEWVAFPAISGKAPFALTWIEKTSSVFRPLLNDEQRERLVQRFITAISPSPDSDTSAKLKGIAADLGLKLAQNDNTDILEADRKTEK
jgi:hypothetical protein